MIPVAKLEPLVVGELQRKRHQLGITREIDVDEYIKALSFGFMSLYYPINKKGAALGMKYEFSSLKNNLPGWWLYYWDWEKDYDLSDYDTGDPIELAMKILIGWTKSWKYFKSNIKPRGVKIWTKDDFENIFNISERIILDALEDGADGAVKTAVTWYSLIAWSGYDFDLNNVKEAIDAAIDWGYADNDKKFISVVMGCDSTYLKEVGADYMSWLPWPNCIRR